MKKVIYYLFLSINFYEINNWMSLGKNVVVNRLCR